MKTIWISLVIRLIKSHSGRRPGQLMTLNEVLMNTISSERKWAVLVLMLGTGLLAPSPALALRLTDTELQAPQAQQPSERPAQQAVAPQDPITQLNLSPQQRQQIRSIREQTKDERATINRRLQETKVALDQAVDADIPDEALIERRAREASDAQAAALRLRVITQARIRRVLTPEQVNTLRRLQAQLEQSRREERLENRANQGGNPNANRRALGNQGNGITNRPGLRRNGLPRKP
jgi:protein CpxP